VGTGQASADSLLTQAQAVLTTAWPSWQFISSLYQQASSSTAVTTCGGTLDASFAGLLQFVSTSMCQAASLAVQAAELYAPRCAAAAAAAAQAKVCPGLDLSNEQAQGTSWGVIWNGVAYCLDPNALSQVARQVQQAQASVQSAQAAKTAACPRFARVQPNHPRFTIPTPPPVLLAGLGRGGHRVGLGDLTFDEWMQDPNFAAQWAQVKAQVQSEGGANLIVSQNSMLSAANELASVSEITVNPQSSQIISAAAGNFAILGTTALGAINSIGGLIQESQQPGGAQSQQVVQAFTGVSMAAIGLAVGVGAVTAGAGAAIAAGIGIVASLVGPLFNGPAPVQTIGECNLNYEPTLMVSDSFVWSINGAPTTAGPSTAAWSKWRRFPNANKSSDAAWFEPGSIAPFDWYGDKWAACIGPFRPVPVRPIDMLFENGAPVYAQLEGDNFLLWAFAMSAGSSDVYTALVGLYNAFLAAWKSNREYGLNGLQRQSDAQVLAQTVAFWNAAHEPGQGFDMPAAQFQPYQGAQPLPSVTPYMAMLIGSVQQSVPPVVANQLLSSSGALHINTGPVKNVSSVAKIGIKVGPIARLSPGAATPAPATSTGSKILLGIGIAAGIAAAAEGYYAWRNKISYGQALKRTWSTTGGRAVRFVRRHV
jgi:hypothetical protein